VYGLEGHSIVHIYWIHSRVTSDASVLVLYAIQGRITVLLFAKTIPTVAPPIIKMINRNIKNEGYNLKHNIIRLHIETDCVSIVGRESTFTTTSDIFLHNLT